MNCQAKSCNDPACTLHAWEYPTGREWRFCLQHFWPGVHALLNRGAERVIVRYLDKTKMEKLPTAPWLGRQEPTP